MIFNLGGPSNMDLWGMKPDAPAEIRGPFKPIRTKTDAFEVSELLPKHAAIADKFSFVRNCHHDGAAVHDAGWQIMQTSRRFTGGIQTPHAGSVTGYLLGRRTDLPPFVVLPETMGRGGGNLPNGQAGGFLGKAHDPFALMADPSKPSFRVPGVYVQPALAYPTEAEGQIAVQEDFVSLAQQRMVKLPVADAGACALGRGIAQPDPWGDAYLVAGPGGKQADVQDRHAKPNSVRSPAKGRRHVISAPPNHSPHGGPAASAPSRERTLASDSPDCGCAR